MSDHITRDELRELIDAAPSPSSRPSPPRIRVRPPPRRDQHPAHRGQGARSPLLDKDAAIVTYCSNTACPNSGVALAQLRKLGYTNVRKYAEGKQDWEAAGLPLVSEFPGSRGVRPS